MPCLPIEGYSSLADCGKIKVIRSDMENLIVAGYHFYVCARYSKKVGWNVLQA